LIIDFHTHIFPPAVCEDRECFLERDAWFGLLYSSPKAKLVTADNLVHSMTAAGVNKAVAFGFAWEDPGLCRETNDYVIESVSRFPDRLMGFAAVSPAYPSAAQKEIDRCVGAGLRGIGELTPAGQNFAVDDERVMAPLAEVARHHQLPIVIHTNEPVGHEYPGKGLSSPWGVVRFAQRFPDVVLVCAHWGGGLIFYELMPELLTTLKNVYYDTAASLRLYRNLIFPIGMQIAPDKVLFGTDYPLLDHRRYLGRLRVSGLSSVAERQLLGENARRVLRLGERPA
jgi:hypothetical protein